MGRKVGNAIFSANFEPRVGEPLDARLVVDYISDLTLLSTWNKGDGNAYVYVGMVVSVIENNSIYLLKDLDYTQSSNWELIGNDGSDKLVLHTIIDNNVSIGTGVVWNPDNNQYESPQNKTQVVGLKLSDTELLLRGKTDASSWGLTVGIYYFNDNGSLTQTRTSVYAGEYHGDGNFILSISLEDGASNGGFTSGVGLISTITNYYSDGFDFVGTHTIYHAGDYYIYGYSVDENPDRLKIQRINGTDYSHVWTKNYEVLGHTLRSKGITSDGTYLYLAWTNIDFSLSGIMKIDTNGNVIITGVYYINGGEQLQEIFSIHYSVYGEIILIGRGDIGRVIFRINPNLTTVISQRAFPNVYYVDCVSYNISGNNYLAVVGRASGGVGCVTVFDSNLAHISTNTFGFNIQPTKIIAFNDSGVTRLMVTGSHNGYCFVATLNGDGVPVLSPLVYDSSNSSTEFVNITQINATQFIATGIYPIMYGGWATITVSGMTITEFRVEESIQCDLSLTKLIGCSNDGTRLFGTTNNGVGSGNDYECFIKETVNLNYTGTVETEDGHFVLTRINYIVNDTHSAWTSITPTTAVIGSANNTSSSDVRTNTITTYNENISDGVVRPFREHINYISSIVPTSDFDDVDSAGNNRFFKIGDLCIVNTSCYVCKDNTTNNAIWEKISGGDSMKRIDVDSLPIASLNIPFSFGQSPNSKWFPDIFNYINRFLFEVYQEGIGIIGTDLLFVDDAEFIAWMNTNATLGHTTIIKCYYYEDQKRGSINALKANNFGYSLLRSGRYKSSIKTLGDAYFDSKWGNQNHFIKSIYNDFLGIDSTSDPLEYAKAIWFPKNQKKLYTHHRDDLSPAEYIEIQVDISGNRNVFDITGNLFTVNTLSAGSKMEIIDSKFYKFNKSVVPATFETVPNNSTPNNFIRHDSVIKVYLLKEPISGYYTFYVKPVGVDNFYINGISDDVPIEVLAVSKGSSQTKYYNINVNYINLTINDILLTFNKNDSLLQALSGNNYAKFLSKPDNVNSNKVSFILNYGNGVFSKPTKEIKFLVYKRGVSIQIQI